MNTRMLVNEDPLHMTTNGGRRPTGSSLYGVALQRLEKKWKGALVKNGRKRPKDDSNNLISNLKLAR